MPVCENNDVTLVCLKQQNHELRCGRLSKFRAILFKLAFPKPGFLSADTEESAISLGWFAPSEQSPYSLWTAHTKLPWLVRETKTQPNISSKFVVNTTVAMRHKYMWCPPVAKTTSGRIARFSFPVEWIALLLEGTSLPETGNTEKGKVRWGICDWSKLHHWRGVSIACKHEIQLGNCCFYSKKSFAKCGIFWKSYLFWAVLWPFKT